jgi:hemerythrin superfamily protein
MNAIELLTEQHREVDDLFEELEDTKEASEKQEIFDELADMLAVHATIEERHFYPAVKERRTEDILLEALEEHLSVKRLLADLLDCAPSDETFDAKVSVLKEQVQHHVKEEEGDLFPKVKKLMSSDELEAIGQEMTATQVELEEQEPRKSVRAQTESAPPLG